MEPRTKSPVLILPGYGGSGPAHWQSEWECLYPEFHRVEQSDWEHPDLAEWSARLEEAVAAAVAPPVLVAHSLACLLVAHWATRMQRVVAAALLVAPPDPAQAGFPSVLASFGLPPRTPLPFPSIVVGSTDDPYAAPAFGPACAAEWGSEFISAGAAGHINAGSGLGAWPAGLALLRRLTR
ncbi:MAG: alpha/beta hydrolase [Opitutaceae bacterium]|nr:alpha/beta hydrolase [Opitutaceae bacterium]